MTEHDILPADNHALLARFHERREPHVREVLIERFMPLARHLSRRYHARGEADDLEQVAALALWKAIERFDPGRGLAFSTYAVPTIIGELKRYFRDQGWMVRVPRALQELQSRAQRAADELTAHLGRPPTAAELAQHCGVSVEEIVELQAVGSAYRPASLDMPSSSDPDAEERGTHLSAGDDPGFERAETAAVLDGLLRTLSERDAQIIRMRFEEDLTQSEIGARMGLSQIQVSRIIRESIERLQAAARGEQPQSRRRLL